MKKKLLLLALAPLALYSCTDDTKDTPEAAAEGQIYINEICPGEKKIELYNSGSQAVDITGYILTKDDKDKWKVTEDFGLIPGGGRIVLTCKQEDAKNGPTFGLSGLKGFKLALSYGTKTIDSVDNLTSPLILADSESYGRKKDGDDYWAAFSTGSLGAPNATGTPRTTPVSAEIFINEIDCKNKTIEFYNASSSAASLNGWVIAKDDNDPWAFTASGSTVPAQGFLTLKVKKDDWKNGPVFGLSGTKGFDLKLYCAREMVDHLDNLTKITPVEDGRTFGRSTDGGNEWVIFTTGTMGFSNAGGVRNQ